MHISWIGVVLKTSLNLLVLSNGIHGKAFLDEGKQNYYSEVRNGYQPIYGHQSYAANPKLFYTPQIDGQPIYIPAISGSEHVNKFLDDYYKINRDYSQSWTLAPPVTYDYDVTSEGSYYENGVTSNSMVKNFLEEKYKDGAYSSYLLPATPGNLPKHEVKTTDNKKGIEYKVPGNKTPNRKKKRPHAGSTESYYTQYKLKTEIPEGSTTVQIKSDYKKQANKSPGLAKSDISGVDDYDEMDNISTFELKEDKTNDKKIKTEMNYSKDKDKKRQPVKHKKSKNKHVSKSNVENYVTGTSDLKHSKHDKTTETLKYSTNKINNKGSAGKHNLGRDAINEQSDDDYEPEIVDIINDYEPEVVDVNNELSDVDYEPEVLNKLSNEDYQDDVVRTPENKDFETDIEDNEGTVNFSSKKDKNKIKNGSVYSNVKNEMPKKVKQQSVKVSNKQKKPVNDYTSDDMALYKSELVQSSKYSEETKNKMPLGSNGPEVDQVNELSNDDYEPDEEDELTDDHAPEVVDVINKQSDDDLETDEDSADLSDIDDLDSEVDIINEEKNFEPEIHLGNENVLDTFTSEKDKAKPSKPVKAKPVKAKPSKPVKAEPSKPVKVKPVKVKPGKPSKVKPTKNKDHDKNTDNYNESGVKSNLKEKPPKVETKHEFEQNYETDGHVMKGKDKVALADESVIENQTEDLVEIHSRDFLNPPTDLPPEVEEFDGSGSQAIDTSMRRIPQFFKNVESIRNLTSLNSNIWSLIFNPNAERNELKRCVTRSNETGICTYVQQCDVPNIATSLEQLLNNACVIDDMFIGVCCPEFPVQTVKVHWDDMPSNSEKQSEDEFGHSADDCGIRSDDAKKTESWPWQAPLVSMSNGKVFCGGVIINDDYILTAAHCTTKIPKNQILVRLGQHDETSGDDFAVVEIKRHAQYNPRTLHNDIALLKLGKRITRDKHTDAVCLPEADDDDDHEDEKAILLGRKGRFSQVSKQTEWLKVISNNECEKKLGSKVPSILLCTDARDENERTCNLDSGAPLVVEDDDTYEVIGILSWNRNDCDERFPSTFSRVSKYVRWIQKHAV